MKFSTLVCCGLMAAGGAGTVLASPFGEGTGFSLLVQAQGPGPAPGGGREAEKSMPRRDMRGSGDAERGRMNPEERRQLRRDIQDAGKDIYRQAPQRRGEGRRSERR